MKAGAGSRHWRSLPVRVLGILTVVAVAPTCHAHIEEAAAGFASGFFHPVFGLDHFLAMLSVGIVSAQLGGRRIWTIPAAFLGAMITGGVIGIYGTAWPLAEAGIALSVVVLGLSIVGASQHARTLPIFLATVFFGTLHGHAHGLEIPVAADPVFYAAGFVMSTALIHLLGVGIGHILMLRLEWQSLLRYLGSGMAGIGLVILMAP